MLLAWDERDREGQASYCASTAQILVSLDLAGWLAFSFNTVSYRQATQRCYVDVPKWLKVTVQVRWPCPCQPIFVAPIGRAPSSPTSRFTCMYICDGDHAVRSIDDEGGGGEGPGAGPGHTQHADCSHGFLLASSFRFSLALLTSLPPAAALVARNLPCFSSYNCTVTLLTRVSSYRMFS
ncbi:hypothetical protein V8C40DRAFT_71184 [Trichoderma camerunense]